MSKSVGFLFPRTEKLEKGGFSVLGNRKAALGGVFPYPRYGKTPPPKTGVGILYLGHRISVLF